MSNIPSYAKVRTPKSARDHALELLKQHPQWYFFQIAAGTKDGNLPTAWNTTGNTNDPAVIRTWPNDCNAGVVLQKSKIVAADVDTKPGKVGENSFAKLELEHGEFPATYTVRTATGGRHYYYSATANVPPRTSKQNAFGPDIDLAPYLVIAGSVVDGKPYTVIKDAPVESAPDWFQEYLKQPEKAESNNAPRGDTIPLDHFKAMLRATPYEGRHSEQDCVYFLMAAHEAAGGEGGDYLEAAIEWCLNDPNPDWTEPTSREWVESKWERFNDNRNVSITRASWFKGLADIGRSDLIPQPTALDDFANDNDAEAITPERTRVYPDGYMGDELEATDFPPVEEIIEGLILKSYPQTCDADGGTGKSLVCAQMAVHRASGAKFLGRKVQQGPAIFITHEDDYAEVKKRMQAAAKSIGLKDGLKGLPLRIVCILDDDLTIANIADNGTWKQGPYYAKLDAMLAAAPGALVFLDCMSDFAQGDFLTSRPVPNTFYKVVLAGLCKRHGATPVVICHPSKAAMADGSWSEGNTANRTAVRRKLVMKLVDKKQPDGARWFGPVKNNYAAMGTLQKIVFRDGIFVLDTDPNLSADTVTMYEKITGKIVEMIQQGLVVVKFNQADGHGPAAIEQALAEDRTADDDDGIAPIAADVLAAMNWAERKGRLRYIRADRNKHTKAHYEIPDPSAEAAADFAAE